MSTPTADRVAPRVGRTVVAVEATGTRPRVLVEADGPEGGALLRPMLLHGAGRTARVSLVPEGAMLLAGDHLDVRVDVGPDAALEIVEPAGTVAYDMRGGTARWAVSITLGPGARLTWGGQPLVVAAGADVERTTVVTRAVGAVLALRETVVLGRYGEWPGALRQDLAITGPAGPELVEELVLDPLNAVGLWGRHRVMSSVLLLGASADGPADDLAGDRFDLEAGGVLWRALGNEVHATLRHPAWHAARDAVSAAGPTSRGGPVSGESGTVHPCRTLPDSPPPAATLVRR
ncbi:urease accessory protein UreD [Nocardioides sp. R-C-SC26]|uniref:urease accessory protein UreD n=1 Tax=Nocardioides sp. R-C-SC26 TaxID=2870414 RepID=UPI001E62CD15|nr:urease accessory protein UreD [Nocardioides sp. R-C-SC26]